MTAEDSAAICVRGREADHPRALTSGAASPSDHRTMPTSNAKTMIRIE